MQQSSSSHSSVHCDAPSDAASEASQAGRGSHPSQVHEWVPRQASGGDSFQSVVSPGKNVAKPVVESSEAVSLSGPDSLEGAQELWAAMGPTTAFWLDPQEQLDSSVEFSWETSPARSGEETGEEILSDENEIDVAERRRWQEWAKHAAEHERQRRMKVRVMCLLLNALGVSQLERTRDEKVVTPCGALSTFNDRLATGIFLHVSSESNVLGEGQGAHT